jgi:hypothetical protein
MECPSDQTLAQLIDGKLEDEARPRITAHADECAACRRVLAELARDALPPSKHAYAGQEQPSISVLSNLLPTPLARGTSVGGYMIVDVVGKGGMGIVYSAYDPDLDRKVALKVLLSDSAWSSDPVTVLNLRQRLRREAQAMARLSHPNVVTVFDAGIADGQLFIAMELIEGATLGQWLSAEPRCVADILRQFVAAGRGLEAAHSVGFVHRDFKPGNVLVGRDGRVCITDFGLARLVDESVVPASPLDPTQIVAGTLTQSGTLLGTPSYMAPEQLEGKAADARSDQFGFCIALYEALYGERPFAGRSITELRSAVLSGSVRESASGRKIAPRLRQILMRGLQADPSKRYPSMSALLRDLGRDPAKRRRQTLLLGASLLATLALGVGLTRTVRQQRFDCGAGNARLTGIWDATTKAAIHDAFSRTGKPYAEDVWRAVEHALDAFASAWTRNYTEACEATHVRGEQSAELLDLRMDCLNHRLDETGVLASLFTHADASLLEKALSAVQANSDLSSCADVRALRSRLGPPHDPSGRAGYDALERHIAQLQALLAAGRYSDARKTTDKVVEEARRVGHPVLLSEAFRLSGELYNLTAEYEKALRPLQEAAVAAERGADDGRAASAWDSLALASGMVRHGDDGDRWLEYGAAAGERAGSGDLARAAGHLKAAGMIEQNRDRYAAAAALLEESAALYHRVGQQVSEAESLRLAGWNFISAAQLDTAHRDCNDALRVFEKLLGAGHPYVAKALNCLSAAAIEANRPEEVVALSRRAAAIAEATNGQRGSLYMVANGTLAQALNDLGDYAGALAAAEKAENAIQSSGSSPWNEQMTHLLRDTALLGLGRAREALPSLEAGYQWIIKNSVDRAARADRGLALARALTDTGQDRVRARQLAQDAANAIAGVTPTPHNDLIRKRVADWLRGHGVR